jgi:cold shock CspA family protein
MRGVVLFWKAHDNRPGNGFGFIVPDGGDPSQREANYYFGPKALNGRTVKSGDRVEFDDGTYGPGKGPQANRVWLRDDDDREQRD